MRLSTMIAGLLALAAALALSAAEARPARVIILRHGEKANSTELCSVGELRAQALADQVLGKGAPGNEAIFGKGGRPDAFFAITVHTQETAAPSARSWGERLTVFPVEPKDPNENDDLDNQTMKAVAALESPEYEGKTVVLVWEHKRIANKDLNKANETLWSLLGFAQIVGSVPPKTWEGENYDYIWIIDYQTSEPTFTPVRQQYAAAAYAQIPDNLWGQPVDSSKFPQFYDDCKH